MPPLANRFVRGRLVSLGSWPTLCYVYAVSDPYIVVGRHGERDLVVGLHRPLCPIVVQLRIRNTFCATANVLKF